MNPVAIIIETRPLNIQSIIAKHEPFLPKDWDVWHIGNERIDSIADYNRLLTSRRFWRNMPDHVLIFQHDSELLRTGVEDYLEFDFVGADIPKIDGCMNGGLSIRSKKAMLRVIDNIPYTPELGNEDIYFCNGLRQLSGYLPTKEEVNKFAVETSFHLGSVGCHAIEKYLNFEQCNLIKNQYGKR